MAIEFSSIKSGPRIVKSAYSNNAGPTQDAADPAVVQDTADVAEAPSHHGFLAALGGGLMVALSLGGTFAAPAMAAPPAISQSLESSNLGTLSDQQAVGILNKMPGLKNTSFASHFCMWGCTFDGSKALERLKGNGAVDVPRQGTQQTDRISNVDQLAELATLRGLNSNSGVSNGIVHAFEVGHFSKNGDSLTDFQAFDAVRHGQTVSDTVGGRSYQISKPEQAQELNALEGDGQGSPLSAESTALIKRMAEQTPGEGLYANGHRLNAYEYLQAAKGGQGVTYEFTGGPYHEATSLRASLGQLENVAQNVANQHRADQVRPSQGFFNREMKKLNQPLQQQVAADAQHAQALIDGGKTDVQRYTAAAAEEARAIPGAQADVDAAQAALNQVMPGWQDAAARANDAQQRVNDLSAASIGAHNQEAQATQAYQVAQSQLVAARTHLQQVLNPQGNAGQAPADPDAATSTPGGSQAPSDPDAAPAPARAATAAPADPDAAPSDPDAGSGSNFAIAQKAQAQAAVQSAQQQVSTSYDAMRQAIANRVTADIMLGQAQSRLPDVQDTFARADGVKTQAERQLRAAQDVLAGHQNAQAQDQQTVQQAEAQIRQGQQALESAHQLQQLANKYVSTPDAQTLQQMASLASNGDLKANLARQHLLFEAMSRPAAPAGYTEPTPLVYSEQ